MLEFRPIDYAKDIDEVVSLIQKYLQPAYSKEFLIWKHLENPFGTSYSMVATFKGEIVGVLFYMRYDFYNKNGDCVKCIRPFDACTSPEMRGKGIFKKLMVACLEKYKNDYQILLANPNANSYPEFLKLGWKEPPGHNYVYKFGILNPSLKGNKGLFKDLQPDENSGQILDSGSKFLVGNSLKFIQWRYKDPIYKIKKLLSGGSVVAIIVYRIDRIKGIKTIVLCDYYGESKLIQAALQYILRKEGTVFIYFLLNSFTENIKPLAASTHKKALIVFKENNYKLNEDIVISLGDLEGRL
ncbi:GNAT family N-acetyltransferase [Salegentibacter chungangensis]|uniref:GNAT family N-acetyltransferase n=1 Tax=Salegentibacter chungangensis TaxID=1335724 RepID=A0ABW3NVE8_9FLAO